MMIIEHYQNQYCKNFTIITVVVVLCISLFLNSCSHDSIHDSVSIEISPPTILLNESEPATKQIINVKIKNTGDEVMLLNSIKPSCNCSIYKDINQSIEPGEEIDVAIDFELPLENGKFKQTAVLFVNDLPSIEIPIFGSVMESLSAAPRSAFIKDNNSVKINQFRIKINKDDLMRIPLQVGR